MRLKLAFPNRSRLTMLQYFRVTRFPTLFVCWSPVISVLVLSSKTAFSAGFDSTLTKTDLKTGKKGKTVDINALLKKKMGETRPTPAFVYHIHHGEITNDLVLSLETGHVISVQAKNPEYVRFCLDAHWNKVYHR